MRKEEKLFRSNDVAFILDCSPDEVIELARSGCHGAGVVVGSRVGAGVSVGVGVMGGGPAPTSERHVAAAISRPRAGRLSGGRGMNQASWRWMLAPSERSLPSRSTSPLARS